MKEESKRRNERTRAIGKAEKERKIATGFQCSSFVCVRNYLPPSPRDVLEDLNVFGAIKTCVSFESTSVPYPHRCFFDSVPAVPDTWWNTAVLYGAQLGAVSSRRTNQSLE